jgi:hypothetical protein
VERHDRAILRDDRVGERQVARRVAEVVQDPSGREHDGDAALPDVRERFARLGADPAVLGDGAVEVEYEHAELHVEFPVDSIACCTLPAMKPGFRERGSLGWRSKRAPSLTDPADETQGLSHTVRAKAAAAHDTARVICGA